MSVVLPPGQHEWEETFRHDEQGRPLPPRFHVLLLGNVRHVPTDSDRRALESFFSQLEGTHAYGSDGLLTAIGWGTTWFENYTDVEDPPVNRPARMARWEDPILEDLDFFIHLAGDDEQLVDGVKEAVIAETSRTLNALEVLSVRTGFVGAGLPAERLAAIGIPESSPLLLGFRSVYKKSQAPEELVTIVDGPFAGGTTAHVSRIVLNVEQWHAKSRDEQSHLLHAPSISAAQAEALIEDAPSDHQNTAASVSRHGIVGHTQAAARARVNDVPLINRRDFATLDDDEPGTHFVSIQRELRDFNNTRAVMNGSDVSDAHRYVGARHRNGINSFMTVTRRATFLIPPRAQRAYPGLRSSLPALSETALSEIGR